jgi:3-hydroxyacyl-[acyl-carrier-protein] dehydratase
VTKARHLWLVDISADHPAFAGHFPSQPILPGVVLLQRVLDLAQAELGQSLANCTLRSVKFSAPVVPGDRLQIELAQSSIEQYGFSVHIVTAGDGPPVLACSGQLRP